MVPGYGSSCTWASGYQDVCVQINLLFFEPPCSIQIPVIDSTGQPHLAFLLTGRLISLYQICRLVLVLLLMPLLTLSNSYPASQLLFLVLFPLQLILREALYLCLKFVNYFSGFPTFWTVLFPNELATPLVF